MTSTVLTAHPEGKAGVNIEKNTYEIICEAIIHILRDRSEILLDELDTAVRQHLTEPFVDSLEAYTTSVRLDLEARGIVECTGNAPQRLKLAD
ncbi:MAG: hypothetical protein K8I60_10590 [Anaerolineae bacterium]|nr:hypothetical protein [Anaerolineae bacterium]